MTLVLSNLFSVFAFHRISAVTQADNTPSIEGLKSLGFSAEGRLRDYYLDFDGQRHDALLLAILRSDDAAKPLFTYSEKL
jgi:RimJ/RimL family protein N-acetyltransferase